MKANMSFAEQMPFLSTYGIYILPILITILITHWMTKSKPAAKKNEERSQSIKKNTATKSKDSSDESGGEEEVEGYFPEDTPHIQYNYKKPSEEDMRKQVSAFYDNMNQRRSIRFFSPEPVPKDIIETIIKTAGTSPSGAHTEPWTFCVVTNPDIKDKIRGVVEQEEMINYQKRMGAQWVADLKFVKTDWNKEYLTIAPVLILVFKQTYGLLPNGKRRVHHYNEISVCIAAGILLAAIQNAGLVTLTSTPLNCGPGLRSILDRPDNEKLLLLLPVGYPTDTATVPDIRRKDVKDIMVTYD